MPPRPSSARTCARGLARTAAGMTLALLLLLLLLLLLASGFSTAAAAAVQNVSVTNDPGAQLSTQLSTNNVWSGMIDDTGFAPTAKTNFNALAAPLVRVHVGNDGSAIAMPEVVQGQWSFDALDVLVKDEFDSGQEPLMNIKFAPDWMWTCAPTQQQLPGQVADQSFQTYAAYMARLVSYYNRGSMQTEAGATIANPAGTSHRVTWWEPWNEPDLSNETPCADANGGAALSPAQYVTMWNAVTAAMLAVDPALKFVGPATAGGQFGAGATDYFTPLMGAPVKPSALAFHGYGYWDNTVGDATIFDGDGSGFPDGGIDDMVTTTRSLRAAFPSTPVWIDEMNVNADWGADPAGRPSGALGAAWWGATFAALAPLHVEMLHQYNVIDGPQFGLMSEFGEPFLPYWEFRMLNAGFPVGGRQLPTSSSSGDLATIAERRPDGKVAILVANRAVDGANPGAGVGLPATVDVSLGTLAPTSVTVQQIDARTAAASGPATTYAAPGPTVRLTFPGYGLAVITVNEGAGPGPAPPIAGIDRALGRRAVSTEARTITLKTSAAAAPRTRVVAFVSWRSGTRVLSSVRGGGLLWHIDRQGVGSRGVRAAIVSAYAPSGLPAGRYLTATFSGRVSLGSLSAASFRSVSPSSAVDGAARCGLRATLRWRCAAPAPAAHDVVVWMSAIDASARGRADLPSRRLYYGADARLPLSSVTGYVADAPSGTSTVRGSWDGVAGASGALALAVSYRSG